MTSSSQQAVALSEVQASRQTILQQIPACKTGVLLLNLGTPDAPTVPAVRKYLKQFLSDPRVVDIPAVARWCLLNFIILPLRSPKSAAAYKKIWTAEGSPLLLYSQRCATQVQKALGPDYQVVLGMRYGNPSIESALQQFDFKLLHQLIVMPLFPHYASASTGSALQATFEHIATRTVIPSVKIISDFYHDSAYLSALSTQLSELFDQETYDYLLMSYHGIPERQAIKSEKKPQCDKKAPCPALNQENRYCYRAQCFHMSRELAKHLKLSPEQWSVSFQSRLGRVPWIQPYTDEVLPKLYQQGVRRLAICCPAFVSDCLETLEEIGMEAKEQWKALGGESLTLLPCLNDHPAWVDGLALMIKNQAQIV